MQTRYCQSPNETKGMDTTQLRSNYLIETLFEANNFHFVYTLYDRVILGGAMPIEPMTLGNYEELKANFFLERREMGIINVGGEGEIEADGKTFSINKLDCLYLGKNTEGVVFKSKNKDNPARYFIMSTPAHRDYPNQLLTKENATPVEMGSVETANERTIYKYIHLDGIRSCQLVMGLTVLYCPEIG